MDKAVQGEAIIPAPRETWREILQADHNSLVDQTPEWVDCMCAAGQYEDASRFYEIAGARMVLPMVRTRSIAPWLAVEASNPHAWGIGGLISDRPLQKEHIHAVLRDLKGSRTMRTAIRPNPMLGDLWKTGRPSGVLPLPRLAHTLDLEGGFKQVWEKRFASYTRTKVRKAEKSGLMIESDTTGRLIPAFYHLLNQSVNRWAGKQNEPVSLARWRANRRDPLSKLELIAERMGDRCVVWMAWSQGQPAAAIIVLKGKNAHSIRGAMNKELAGPTEANTLIQSMAIEDACNSGCRFYHMGETGGNPSLAHFKERFGAEPYAYAEYVIERLPVTAADRWLRTFVKRLIGFKDV
ncbi:MAG TPA: GNAT family N-acetyltransferase [Anaerolineaceae bacterium]